MTPTRTITVTAFGETHEVECFDRGHDAQRIDSVGTPLVGRFPTGTKLHRTQVTLWKRDRGFHSVTGAKLRDLHGPTAAVVDGNEFVLDTVLYTHNSNRGRITGWDREQYPAEIIARW